MKAVVAAFNQEKALVGAFSVITNLRMELFQALLEMQSHVSDNILKTFKGTFIYTVLIVQSINIICFTLPNVRVDSNST